ncbi:MAG TPA: hypothetical protein VMZ91_12675 [Candidatus Paceibacterota bacterium]|nr:hypothetical protein [Candidatus Paceibacterota bacterium]
MKIRNGFVSNSSSSSFICSVCKEEVIGRDISLRDAEMVQCKKGHKFCEEHKLREISIEDKINYVLNDKYVDEESKKLVVKMNEEEFEDWWEGDGEGYSYEFDNEIPSDCCPICSMKSFDENEMFLYLIKETGKTKEEIKKEIQNKYKDYEEFKKYIK